MARTGKNQLAVVSGYQERSLLPDRPKARWKCAKASVLLIFQRCVSDRFLGCLQLGFLFCEAEVPATPVEGSEPNPALPQPRGDWSEFHRRLRQLIMDGMRLKKAEKDITSPSRRTAHIP